MTKASALLFLTYGLLVIATNEYHVHVPGARIAEVLLFAAMVAGAAALIPAKTRAPARAPADHAPVDVVLVVLLGAFYGSLWLPLVHGVDIGDRSPVLQRIAAIGFGAAALGALPFALAIRQQRTLDTGGIVNLLVGVACALKIFGIAGERIPQIDIWDHIQGATRMLAAGINPYMTPNVEAIAVGADSHYPAITFPYPPLVLLLTTAANRWLGDPRYLFVLSDLAAAVLLLRIASRPELSTRTTRYCQLAALLIVFHPNSFAKMWTDLLVFPFLFSITYLTMRSRGPGIAVAVVVGLALTTKPYLLLLAPLFAAWLRRPLLIGVALVTGVSTAIPFLYWDAAALWRSTIGFHLGTPFRPDSMSLASFTYHAFKTLPPRWLDFAVFAPLLAAGVSAVRKQGVAAVPGWSAVSLLWLFAVGQHTFHNYYHGVGGFLLWGGITFAIENDHPPLRRENTTVEPSLKMM